MLRSYLCDYSNTSIVVKERINVRATTNKYNTERSCV